ncbi:MAG TPA: CoA transferase [Dehalococcoidia bacterium]|nr:CoA transferase [Dehalococcoidia bacterium]
MPEQALRHLKVIELCNLVSGPYCTKLLADLGAEVIKIEPPGTGDLARRRGPFLKDTPHPERSGLFLYLNTSKLGITLDIKTPTGQSIFKELIEQTDIFVEDNPPAVMDELGLTYDELKKINPRLVMTSITPFGQTGPYRDYKGHELNVFHSGGEGYMMPIESTYPFREPLKGGGLVGDCVCALSASLATLAAAYSMFATGKGQHVDVSKQDVLMTMVGLEVAMYTYSGTVRTRHKRKAMLAAPKECQDGYIMMSAFGDRDWQVFSRFIGKDSWAKEDRFSTPMKRWENSDEIDQYVEEWTRQYKLDDLFHRLQAKTLAAAPVNTSKDIVNSPQLQVRGFFAAVEHPKAGKLKYPTASYKFSESPFAFNRPAPLLSQHNEEVYCGRLGYSKEELAKLAEVGII